MNTIVNVDDPIVCFDGVSLRTAFCARELGKRYAETYLKMTK
ncbi:hypothetical protein [Prosthecobacter sp.]|nr:hypothetical protein [Prosthecobacter sp.]